MKGPFWIRIRLCSIWFDDKCMIFSSCFFTQYTPPDYLPKVYEDLPMSPTHREAVINAFVYVHQTLHQANERLAKRGGRVMAITPRHYLDFINHYVSIIHDSEMFKTMGSEGGAVVRALASHHCGPGSNPGVDAIRGLSLLLARSFAPRGVSAGSPVFPSP